MPETGDEGLRDIVHVVTPRVPVDAVVMQDCLDRRPRCGSGGNVIGAKK
jgi:hypothetical protein